LNLFDSDGALSDLDMMEKIGKRRERRRIISRTTAASYTTDETRLANQIRKTGTGTMHDLKASENATESLESISVRRSAGMMVPKVYWKDS
jgi:hypothetical protein